jgi:hypothetical protein
MSLPHALADLTEAAMGDGLMDKQLSPGLAAWVASTALDFPIAADPLIDIKRLPPTITTKPQLHAWLISARDRISDPDADTTADGTLRTYKSLIVIVHAINQYLGGTPVPPASSWSQHASNILMYAMGHPPANLSPKGLTLWLNVTNPAIGRSKALTVMILQLA